MPPIFGEDAVADRFCVLPVFDCGRTVSICSATKGIEVQGVSPGFLSYGGNSNASEQDQYPYLVLGNLPRRNPKAWRLRPGISK